MISRRRFMVMLGGLAAAAIVLPRAAKAKPRSISCGKLSKITVGRHTPKNGLIGYRGIVNYHGMAVINDVKILKVPFN